jgi:hypothetical protein
VQELLADSCDPASKAVLEVGFGLGMCAQRIERHRPASHTIIEAHPSVAALARTRLPTAQVLESFWETSVLGLPPAAFEAIAFDAYPLSLPAFDGGLHTSRLYAVEALPVFSRLLKALGKATIIDFSNRLAHDPALHFAAAESGLTFSAVRTKVSIPADCAYARGTEASILVFSKLVGP